MDEPVWYRSLYWRIGLGFIACVAGLLVAQGLLFLWLAGRPGATLAGQPPQRVAALVAADVSAALEANPQLDLEQYVREQFGDVRSPVVLVLTDGRLVLNRDFDPPPRLVGTARAYLRRIEVNRGPRDRRRQMFAPVTANREVVGVVMAAPAGRPLVAATRELGPTLALAAIGLLVTGSAAMAFFVFRPARARLRSLEQAAAAIGAGDTSVRAPETGGDEVARLALAFNQMAADLDRRARHVEEVDRARRQLLGDVSHELMTPLTAIRGYLETLAMPRAAQDAAARERYLRIVTDETLRLESIIGDLLDLARLGGGGVTLQREAVPIDWLFERVAERHEGTLREKEIRLQTRIAPGAKTVDGDARRLEQALQNLAANAVRHTPRGGTIHISADASDGRVRLVVADSGPGIPPEHLPRIFDRFYKAEAAAGQTAEGSGLGLSIVKAIVERHGGTVTAANRPEGGARFEILLDPVP